MYIYQSGCCLEVHTISSSWCWNGLWCQVTEVSCFWRFSRYITWCIPCIAAVHNESLLIGWSQQSYAGLYWSWWNSGHMLLTESSHPIYIMTEFVMPAQHLSSNLVNKMSKWNNLSFFFSSSLPTSPLSKPYSRKSNLILAFWNKYLSLFVRQI